MFLCRKLPTEEETGDVAKRPRYQSYDNNEVLDEEDLMNQYKRGDSPPEALPTGSGVLSGCIVSVSRRIPANERIQSIQVIREQGGILANVFVTLVPKSLSLLHVSTLL